MFTNVIPFCYLPEATRSALAGEVQHHQIEPGVVFLHQGDAQDQRVYVLLEGLVEVVDESSGKGTSRIGAGHYFGERAALFSEPRALGVRAVERSRLVSIEGARFLALFRESAVFAQGMGNILRHKQGVFVAFDRFMAEMLRTLSSGDIAIERLLPLYRDLAPALHRGATDDEIDTSALLYAVRRLPQNVTRCFAYYLTESLPHHQSRPDEMFTSVETAARRRAVYELLPGKNMVLIRDGISDVVDFVTCLCLYVIEARKLRRRMVDLRVLDALTTRDESYPLPFEAAELSEIRGIWPRDTLGRLRDVLLHHEDLRVSVFRHLDNYNSAHAERWTNQLIRATTELLGTEPALLPGELPVHIISSNTHSVPNCLSPWVAQHRAAILGWGADTNHPLLREHWQHETDCCYALLRDYFRAHPEALAARLASDHEYGILTLTETAFTGIGVQLVDTVRLAAAEALDPLVSGLPRGLLVNIDYAFGQQAEHIIACLISLFSHRIRSVNVTGKAGSLVGKRGDILATTAFIEQHQDLFQPVPNNALDVDHLRTLTDRAVHQGPVLTVAGTLLQNRRMLHFNRQVWGCVGLEMEGTYYLSQIIESMNRGVLSDDVILRFVYYVSDLPLDHESNLSGALQANEGIPALYAVTREILSGVAK